MLQIHEEQEAGDVLVFLPGQDDIEALCSMLTDHLPSIEPTYLKQCTLQLISDNTAADIDVTIQQPTKKLKSSHNSSSCKRNIDSSTAAKTSSTTNDSTFVIYPLYAALAAEEQLQAFCPSNPQTRKFVISTNIAETSVTISGIKYVVDSGYVKTRLIQPNTGVEMLKVVYISKAQAQQRCGRAGRTAPGRYL